MRRPPKNSDAMADQTELPQALVEHLEDSMSAINDSGYADEKELLTRDAITTAYQLGTRDADESNLHANELVAEAMQKVIDKRHFDAQDLMAFLMLVNEYEGTDAQSKDTGMIFTTLNLSALGPKLAQYECAKFYLPNGMIEFQIIRKGQILAPATEVEL